jgi:hypothetical protein
VREYRFDRDHNSPFSLIKKHAAKSPQANGTPGLVTFTKAEAEQFQKICQCDPPRLSRARAVQGHLQLDVRLQGNGCNFLVIEPAKR